MGSGLHDSTMPGPRKSAEQTDAKPLLPNSPSYGATVEAAPEHVSPVRLAPEEPKKRLTERSMRSSIRYSVLDQGLDDMQGDELEEKEGSTFLKNILFHAIIISFYVIIAWNNYICVQVR